MTIDARCVGKSFGPHRYVVGFEKVREFEAAVRGGVPSAAYGERASVAPSDTSNYASLPSFAVVFSLGCFAEACADPTIGLDLMRVVHGEQTFEWFEPILPGDVMVTSGTVVEAYRKANKDFLVVETQSTNQHQRLVVKGRFTAVSRG
jgi:hypothetical protein